MLLVLKDTFEKLFEKCALDIIGPLPIMKKINISLDLSEDSSEDRSEDTKFSKTIPGIKRRQQLPKHLS